MKIEGYRKAFQKCYARHSNIFHQRENMEVWIKSLEVDMQVKQKGIELEVRAADGKTQLGDCYATMTGLVWCKGRIKKENGVKLKWDDLQLLCSSDEVLKIALKAAKQALK